MFSLFGLFLVVFAQGPAKSWQKEYQLPGPSHETVCWASGGGNGQNPERSCMVIQYGDFQDLNGDGLVDYVWQVNQDGVYTRTTWLNNATTKRFDLTACESNQGQCPDPADTAASRMIHFKKAVPVMFPQRIYIRLHNQVDSIVQIAKPESLEELIASGAEHLGVEGPCKIIHSASKARITSLKLIYAEELLEFACRPTEFV